MENGLGHGGVGVGTPQGQRWETSGRYWSSPGKGGSDQSEGVMAIGGVLHMGLSRTGRICQRIR